MLATNDRISRARVLLERKNLVSPEFINKDIHSSWERCLETGLDPCQEPEPQVVSRNKLDHLRGESDSVLDLAMLEMKNLHQQIAGSNFAIVFAHPNGAILESISDESFNTIADASRIAPGNLWNESINGTNALGLAIQNEKPSMVHGGEHFYRKYANLTCVAVPIFNTDKTLAGVLDASSDCGSRQQHTMALVKMSSLTIENGLFRERYWDKLILEFHHRHEFLGTLHSGMLAFEENGQIVGFNRQAEYLLQGIKLEPMIQFKQLFSIKFMDFINALQKKSIIWLTDELGSSYAIKVYNPLNYFRSKTYSQPVDKSPILKPNAKLVIIQEDPRVIKAMEDVERAVQMRVPVLIRGATGTGKEFLARHAHAVSGRKGAFVPVNCAALPESLIESELFGYNKGSFTGANPAGSKGLIEQADGGTLFLDEIGDMSPQLQAALLRFLDDWRIRAIGAVSGRQVDVQFVSATNKNLEISIQSGLFRVDLLYRINSVEVFLPPLKERSDLRIIIMEILKGFDKPLVLTPASIRVLTEHHWPGNFRELRSFLLRLAIRNDEKPIGEKTVRNLLGISDGTGGNIEGDGNSVLLKEREQDIVMGAYQRHYGNISSVARELGISRNTVYKRLEEAESEGKFRGNPN